jgi:hypothetical protein
MLPAGTTNMVIRKLFPHTYKLTVGYNIVNVMKSNPTYLKVKSGIKKINIKLTKP